MKNKIQKLKFGLIAFAILMFSLSFTSATIFHLNVEGLGALTQKMLTDNMMYVHFADNWNDFWWFIYFSNKSWDQTWTYEVWTSNTSSYECGIKMKWFYYNAERWERLWPLSSEDLSIGWLDMSWWIYTNCAKSWYVTQLKECEESSTEGYDSCVNRVKNDFKPDNYWYYGSLNHVYSWKEYHLVVGVNYDTGTQFLSIKKDSDLSPTFIRINNRYPVWFIYDYNGWVWLAWCRFDPDVLGRESMKYLFEEYTKEGGLTQIFILTWDEEPQVVYTGHLTWINCSGFSAENDLVKIIIEWIVWVDENWNLFGWQGNYTDTKMQYFGTKSVTNATLMNYAVKKAESLCRWKWEDNPSNDSTIICSKNWFTNTVGLDWIAWKTLIVKNWNVTVKPFTGRNETRNYDIYLLSGNLIIDESGLENDKGKFVFNTGWFVSSTLVNDFSGKVSSDLDSYISGDVAVWSFIRWNFIVNGNVIGTGITTNGKLNNKYFIYGKFTTKDSIGWLENVFSWSCNNGYGSDGNYCPDSKWNHYKNASLIVIDQNYKSPVLGS